VTKCLIWGTSARAEARLGDYEHINSRRAGGEYKVSGSNLHAVQSLSGREKARLTSWIVAQHRAGIAVPLIDESVLDQIKTGRAMSFSERVDRALLFLGARTKLGGTIAIDEVSSESRKILEDFLAFTESADSGEAQSLLKMMSGEMGLVARPNPSHDTLFGVLPKGWLRLDDLQKRDVQSAQAFIAMWFNSLTEEPYQNGIYKAIHDSGYEPRRVDQKHHHLNKVDDEIIAENSQAQFACSRPSRCSSVRYWTCEQLAQADQL
jgi:hypothetical protein